MAEETTIVPAQITELRAVPAEEINKMADQILEAAHNMNRTNEAMEDLHQSLFKLAEAKDSYDKIAPKVKKQMRDLTTRL